ncbi:MAG: hypothetical protein K9N46_09240 [Candidatus Marinimicrobia bacterium]|nr:hypothetical protein [Candidatus Neomarinimicrobiota bacterium]MCF7829423.1 hypothetical protein [Candidatus Neomarinimicrobiota bacterium]MCF7880909.1 hypothetical protein [Candidatus Neomarinimicrobiota bacterium]
MIRSFWTTHLKKPGDQTGIKVEGPEKKSAGTEDMTREELKQGIGYHPEEGEAF